METYAKWVLWVGIAEVDLQKEILPEPAEDLLESITKTQGPIHKNGLPLVAIYMHGEQVGYGVIISETKWSDEISAKNVFDTTVVRKAKNIRNDVAQIFKEVGIPNKPKIYNHIDLGE